MKRIFFLILLAVMSTGIYAQTDDKGYKEAMEQNFGTVVKIESELQSENEDVEMHNGRRLSHAKYDNDKNKQDEFE